MGPKRNLDHRSFFSLGRYLNDELIQIIYFFESSLKLKGWDCYWNCTVLFWAKLTMAFTCTGLILNLYSSVFGSGCGFGFEQKFWRIDGFGEKKDRRICIPLFIPLLKTSCNKVCYFKENYSHISVFLFSILPFKFLDNSTWY